MIILTSTLVTLMPISLVRYHSNIVINTVSIVNRYKLNNNAYSLIKLHPLSGTGLNQFTPSLIENNLFSTAPFLQPAHNIYLLWITETGFIGTLLTLLLLGIILIKYRRTGFSRILLAPLVALLTIGLYDHYPLTSQTGQLLLVYSLALVFSPSRTNP